MIEVTVMGTSVVLAMFWATSPQMAVDATMVSSAAAGSVTGAGSVVLLHAVRLSAKALKNTSGRFMLPIEALLKHIVNWKPVEKAAPFRNFCFIVCNRLI